MIHFMIFERKICIDFVAENHKIYLSPRKFCEKSDVMYNEKGAKLAKHLIARKEFRDNFVKDERITKIISMPEISSLIKTEYQLLELK